MTGDELRLALVALRTYPVEFAKDREVSRATVFRWMNADRVPLHIEERIKALLAAKAARAKLKP